MTQDETFWAQRADTAPRGIASSEWGHFAGFDFPAENPMVKKRAV